MKLLLNYIYNRSLDTNDATIDLYNNIEKVNNDSISIIFRSSI